MWSPNFHCGFSYETDMYLRKKEIIIADPKGDTLRFIKISL